MSRKSTRYSLTVRFTCAIGSLDLKNQGIDTSQKAHSRGSEGLTSAIYEGVQRHAKNSCKDLVSLMQINSKFISRICTVLTKRVTEPTYSAE